MLFRQSKNSFIRVTPHYGYITNQLTYHDRVYDDNGATFLSVITRKPKTLKKIVSELQEHFVDVNEEILEKDFLEFAEDLARDKFIVMGESVEELETKDEEFTYDIENPKTLKTDFTQQTSESISQNTQDYFLEKNQGTPLISNLQLELSSRCNERCIHCYIPNAKKNSGTDMPFNLFKKIVDEFVKMGGISITLSGGEAFLHKDIIPMLNYCRENDLKITVLSNLLNLTESLKKALKDCNVSLVQVSLYSMDPEIHDTITTVKGSYEKTLKSIEDLVEADVPVQISCPLMKANKDGYVKVLQYAKSLKIKAQTDYIMMAQSDLDTTNLSQRLSIDETEKVLRDLIEYDDDYKENIALIKPLDSKKELNKEAYLNEPLCGVGYDNCCITVNGDVYPCAGWQNFILGNVYKTSLKEIWEKSERINRLRTVTRASFPKCLDCEAKQYCAMCLVRNYNESNGDMFKINDHFCQVAFLNKKILEESMKDRLNELKTLFS